MRAVRRSTIGWKCTSMPPDSTARASSCCRLVRCAARTRMAGSNTSTRPLPACFAAYMAMSASRSRSSADSRPSRDATPTLAPIRTSWPATPNGRRRVSTIRRPTDCASSGPPCVTTANSSPPSRAVVSSGRTHPSRRCAAERSSSSPAGWPSVSFTFLKPSRSTRITDSRRRAPAEVSAVAAGRSSSARLARPVSGSWWAWCVSSSSSARRSVTSRPFQTSPRTSGSPSRFWQTASTERMRPSWVRSRSSIVRTRPGRSVSSVMAVADVGPLRRLDVHEQGELQEVLRPVAEQRLDGGADVV